MSESSHAFEFINSTAEPALVPAYVLFGDDVFLKGQSLRRLRAGLVGTGDSDMSVMQFDGDTARWKDIVDELRTISLFGSSGPRIVIVREADDMITAHRGEIEDYLAKPMKNSALILTVASWLKTTRLHKLISKIGTLIECRAPIKSKGRSTSVDEDRVVKWIKDWGKQTHGLQLTLDAARQVLDLVGAECGLLDQSLAKLALFANDAGKLAPGDVQEIVGGWHAKTTWEMIDAAAAGDAASALEQLHRLIQSGQHANALYGQIAWSLRRYADAAEIFYRGKRDGNSVTFEQSLESAGFRRWPPEAFDAAKKNMKQLGRQRIDLLYNWLVEADLELKGSHSSPHRSQFSLEKLIFRMADKSNELVT